MRGLVQGAWRFREPAPARHPAGVVAASGGNHGVAVAYAAHRLGIPATIFVPAIAGRAKINAIRSLGAGLHFAGAVRVIGVEPDSAPTLTLARASGGPADAPTGSIAADVLAPRRVGDLANESPL
jgi:threonine dehydratase